MKRFLSVLLVAILIVTSLSAVAFAAEVVKTGDLKTFTVSVSGDEFSTYKVSINVGAGLELVSIDAPYVYGTNVGFMNGGNNVTGHSFQVTVRVTATEPGTYYVSAAVVDAGKTITLEDGTKQIVPVSLSASGAAFTIECEHRWGDWTVVEKATCDKEGTEKRVCSICGEEETRAIAKTAHDWSEWTVVEDATCKKEGLEKRVCSICGAEETRAIALVPHTLSGWKHDEAKHWHVCSVCGEIVDESKHEWLLVDSKDPTPEEDGWNKFDCYCGRSKTEVWEYGKEPQVGDIRPMILMGIAAVVTTLAAASYVFKRKNVI